MTDDTNIFDETAILVAAYDRYEELKKREGDKEKPTKTNFHKDLYALKTSDDDFERYTYETFTKCFRGEWPQSDEIQVLLLRMINSWGISVEELVSQSNSSEAIYGDLDELSSDYTGGWLTIQKRSKKDILSEVELPDEYRIGLLIYGDSDDDNRRKFVEIGVSTFWTGDVYKKGTYLYHKSFERSRFRTFEKTNCITKQVWAHSSVKYQFGMRFGTSYDNLGAPLIFSSPLMLWKLQGLEKAHALLDRQQISEYRKYCQYIPVGFDKGTFQAGDLTDQVLTALGVFDKLSRDNQAGLTAIE